MTERKWTPGPWIWVKPNRWPEHQMEEQGLGRFEAGNISVCEFGHNAQFYPTEGEPPNEADGNLIAAAPDLYEALEQARDTILELINARNSEAEGSDEDWVGGINTALAKARGESQ